VALLGSGLLAGRGRRASTAATYTCRHQSRCSERPGDVTSRRFAPRAEATAASFHSLTLARSQPKTFISQMPRFVAAADLACSLSCEARERRWRHRKCKLFRAGIHLPRIALHPTGLFIVTTSHTLLQICSFQLISPGTD
jgi:hypothetical protein